MKLLKELKPNIEKFNKGMLMLRHPMIYSVPYIDCDIENKHINELFKFRRNTAKQALESKDYTKYIMCYERPYRLQAFLDISLYLDDKNYWEILGELYIDTENLFQNFNTWVKLFKSNRKYRNKLMIKGDESYLNFMPTNHLINVYRGISHEDSIEDGLAFTIDENKAEWFANRFNKKGKVIKGEVNKKDILAFFSIRNEWEVVILPGKVKFERKLNDNSGRS